MAINRNHPAIKRALECGRKVATSTNAPMFDMVEAFTLAYADPKSKLKDAALKDFRDLMQELRVSAGHPTLAENRISETWSCIELGAFKCAPELFKNIRKLPSLPGLSALYDISCSLRNRGPFKVSDTKPGMHAGKGLGSNGWDTKAMPVRSDAPTVKQLADALKLGNAARNKNKVQEAKTFGEYIVSVIARFEKERKGYERTVNGKKVTTPPNTSEHLLAAITSLTKMKQPALRVIKGGKANGRKVAKAA